MPQLLSKSLKVALVQLAATADKGRNLTRVKQHVLAAASNGAQLIVLPECFNSPYSVAAFPQYAESIPSGETTSFLSALARETATYLIGGSIPERDDAGKLFNTSLSFSPSGELIAKHRKVHLFDIDIPGKIRFKESDVLAGGDKVTVFDIPPYGKVGLAICYDIRFPELASIAARKEGVFAMIYPGAFNTTTGPLHWDLLGRARAVDNQIYVIMCSPARDLSAGYHAYGSSMVVDPNAIILAQAKEGEEIVYAQLEPGRIEEVRSGIPITTQRRYDVYPEVGDKVKPSAL
ncbi:carbon-nitrogen hydrolase [Lipomyces tetrasporus]|uniref:Carbon-nitrogen hydrolase n=1 Tax=Lipomyces tetrasporus TaxID=54092 RepID=A0AAD7VS53_9ASCO|nr:carbon-nitrogen hydrolase [Lipomyces tetrasporus]KAJ8098785.1 carbon-nitrogen hydrolase [Lipomyces tetrasporus]